MAEEKRICFVAMPSGRGVDAEAYFSGWYSEVIKPAVEKAGFEPFLCAAIDAPNSITEEILLHIIDDPMMVADVGGLAATEAPNPNVMYELGIRHAFNRPVVVMGWKDQFIPFDVKDQRFLVDSRSLNAFARNRERLEKFLQEAEKGNYFRPIEAVSRRAELRKALEVSGNEALARLAEQVSNVSAKVDYLFQETANAHAIDRAAILQLLDAADKEEKVATDLIWRLSNRDKKR